MTPGRLALVSNTLAAAILLVSAAGHAQYTPQLDPANLTGEHVSPQSPADTLPLNHGAAALQQLLLKLRTRASLMMIVAHPDDEDGGMLTYESRGRGARVAMLTLNRGEGGQNLMSADFDDALGLIRTQELLAADRYLGVDQMFGTEIDFGFSKTKEESFEKWTHDRVLYDAVRAVRLYRPLVLTSVFVGGVTDGHGQHQVSGEITQEVFTAAADPRLFPEMGLPPWAPLKVYARVPFSRVTAEGMFDYATGKYSPPHFYNYVTKVTTDTEPKANVTIHEGAAALIEGKPALGMEGETYVQFAREGLALQKTQIGANVRLAPAGEYDVGYTRYGSRLDDQADQEDSFFDGIDISLAGIADLASQASSTVIDHLRASLLSVDRNLAQAQNVFDPAHLDAEEMPLHNVLAVLDDTIGYVNGLGEDALPQAEAFNVLHELRVKRVQANRALVLSLGLQATARVGGPAKDAPLTPGSPLLVDLRVTNASSSAVSLDLSILNIALEQDHTETLPGFMYGKIAVEPRSGKTLSLQLTVPATSPPTQPYFHQATAEQAVYQVSDPDLRDAPATPDPLTVALSFNDQGVPLSIVVPVLQAQDTTPPQAAVIVPRLSVAISPRVAIVPASDAPKPLSFEVTCRTDVANVTSRVELQLPNAWKVLSPEDEFKLVHIYDSHTVQQRVEPTTLNIDQNAVQLPSIRAYALDADHGDKPEDRAALGFRSVGYPGLTTTNLYRPADLRVVGVNVITAPDLKVAYLPGTGDAVPDFLMNLGVRPTILTLHDLTASSLAQYDAVVLGVRAYAAHPELAGAGSKPLLDYARAGGTVIVQYNSAGSSGEAAPYPFDLPGDSAHNVVVEADPVALLAPNAPLLNWPNKITAADFNGWVEERGHGFASTWDPRYEALLETHDPDQDPQKGGLLFTRIGKGSYVYVAFALYRQLPEGVPGAYRLVANLLSLGRNPYLGASGQPAAASAIQSR